MVHIADLSACNTCSFAHTHLIHMVQVAAERPTLLVQVPFWLLWLNVGWGGLAVGQRCMDAACTHTAPNTDFTSDLAPLCSHLRFTSHAICAYKNQKWLQHQVCPIFFHALGSPQKNPAMAPMHTAPHCAPTASHTHHTYLRHNQIHTTGTLSNIGDSH